VVVPGARAAEQDAEVSKILELVSGAPPEPGGGDGGAPPPDIIDPPVRGEGLLRLLDRGFLHLDRIVGRVLPEPFNPFLQTGAIAITALLVATVTGIVLLLWYRPSVHLAYSSVEAMSATPWTAGLMRSLHRYSSDACMFFALVHALRLFLERRFGGARWLAWVTGMAMVGVLWFVGWTGYWLVWDERAQNVALGTARVLDVVPIFADPMGRSFLTDASVNSLLFFVIFFFHMLVPLAIGFFLWLHIARVTRPRFLTRRPMTLWVLGSLVLLSLAYPATNAEPARMSVSPEAFSMDWWYLLPLVLTDRLGGGALWSVLLAGGAVTFTVPWSLGRGRGPAAQVSVKRCNACQKCYGDCPYGAISMVPRTDGNPKHAVQAQVDPAKCVSCGICAGACDTAGIGLDEFRVTEQRRRLAVWLKRAADAGEMPHLAFVCAQSAGASLETDAESGTCPELPGYFVLRVPCAGWLHPFGVEHTLRFGGGGTLVVSCGPGGCRYREGAEWVRQRLEGEREPVLRIEKAPRERVRLLARDRTRGAELVSEARAFREGGPAPAASERSSALTGLAAALVAAILVGAIGVVSDLGYAAPRREGSELVVTLKHPGKVGENCRELSPEELAQRPVHMRRAQICDRARASVRLRVSVDGVRVIEESVPPTGIWSDGNSIAVERLPVEPGEHRVHVAIGDSADLEEWSYTTEQTLSFEDAARRVVAFDRLSGFTWH
jgi:ferredoxin/coenzyme F420-reducing hydrogenase delta subunit